MGNLIPLKLKFFFVAALGVAGTAVLCRVLMHKALEDDHVQYGVETVRSVAGALRAEVETSAKLHLSELENIVLEVEKGKEDQVFRTASSEFRQNVVDITFLHPTGEGTYSIHYATNWDLIRRRKLPQNTVFQINQASPLDIGRLTKSRDTAMLNRSFANGKNPVAIQSFVLFGRHIDARAPGSIVIADTLADEINETRFELSEGLEAFLVNRKGHLLAHADSEIAKRYKNAVFPGFPLNRLRGNWSAGTSFTRTFDGKDWLGVVLPVGIPGVFLCTQVERDVLNPSFAKLDRYFMYAAWSVLGALALLSLWMGGSAARNLRKAATAINCFAAGNFEEAPRVFSFDEFSLIRRALSHFEPKLKERFREEFERGQRESILATTQTLRAALGNPKSEGFEGGWEVVTHRPNEATSFQDFWDVYHIGNRRQVIVGRASTDGVAGVLLALVARATLDNIRRLSQRFAAGKMPVFADILELLSGTLHAAFKGNVCLVANAFELDVDSGNLSWYSCGGPAPLRWKEGTKGVDEKSLAAGGPAIGQNPTTGYKAVSALMSSGERLLIATDSLRGKGSDTPRNVLVKNILEYGQKPLVDLKSTLLLPQNRAVSESVLFFALRRLAVDTPAPALDPAVPQTKAA